VTSFSNADTLTIGSTVYRMVNDEPLDDGAWCASSWRSSSGQPPAAADPRRGEDRAHRPHAEQRGDPPFVNRSDDQALQDAELPAFRIRVRNSDAAIESIGVNRVYERTPTSRSTAA
jgi:hypothetical protein